MVYPVLKINQDDYEIEFVDTQNDYELSIEIDTPELFHSLMELFLEQYNCEYETGYTNAVDDCLEDEEEGEWY